MKKKAISLLLVAAMTATMTAGCGDKQETTQLQETMRHLLQKQQHLMMQQQKKKRKHGAVH